MQLKVISCLQLKWILVIYASLQSDNIYQNADDHTEADLSGGHEGEKAIDGQAAQHPYAIDVVEVNLAAE
jgi:hypothetical protein